MLFKFGLHVVLPKMSVPPPSDFLTLDRERDCARKKQFHSFHLDLLSKYPGLLHRIGVDVRAEGAHGNRVGQ